MSDIWTSRDVRFQCYPRTPAETFDAFMDAAVDHYWETWRNHAFGTLSISSNGVQLDISGWPWWVPKGLARRSVANLAAKSGVGGESTMHVSRSVLVG